MPLLLLLMLFMPLLVLLMLSVVLTLLVVLLLVTIRMDVMDAFGAAELVALLMLAAVANGPVVDASDVYSWY